MNAAMNVCQVDLGAILTCSKGNILKVKEKNPHENLIQGHE